jgi:hypothetical protein
MNKITHPFSENFNQHWQEWKQYKKEQFKFTYREVSEKKAMTHLLKLSNSNEKTAIEIIDQSIANGWKGFWELKNQPQQAPQQNVRLLNRERPELNNW